MTEENEKKEERKNLTDEEKEELKQEGELPSKRIIKKETKATFFILGVVVLLFASFLIPYFYVQEQRFFEYNNFTWQVEKDGEVTFYHTMFGKYYKGQAMGNHHTYLRNDPRENDIPINIGKPEFYKKVFISVDPQLIECDLQFLSTVALVQMTQALPFIENTTIAYTNESYAKENEKLFKTCENTEGATVIEVLKVDGESRVTKDESGDCYFIEIGKCEENIKTTERFVLEVISYLRNTQPIS